MMLIILLTLVGCLIGLGAAVLSLADHGRYTVLPTQGRSWVWFEITIGGRAFWIHWGE